MLIQQQMHFWWRSSHVLQPSSNSLPAVLVARQRSAYRSSGWRLGLWLVSPAVSTQPAAEQAIVGSSMLDVTGTLAECSCYGSRRQGLPLATQPCISGLTLTPAHVFTCVFASQERPIPCACVLEPPCQMHSPGVAGKPAVREGATLYRHQHGSFRRAGCRGEE